jgi:hypothetical protein
LSITSGSGGPFVAPPGPTPAQPVPARAVYVLINGTGNIATFPIPSDGFVHEVRIPYTLAVAVTEVGGALTLAWTQNGARNLVFSPGGLVAGSYIGGAGGNVPLDFLADPGSTVTLSQSSALTGGNASLTAQAYIL